MSSRICLAGLSVLLRKAKCTFVLLSCVACCVSCVSRCWLSSGVSHGAWRDDEGLGVCYEHPTSRNRGTSLGPLVCGAKNKNGLWTHKGHQGL